MLFKSAVTILYGYILSDLGIDKYYANNVDIVKMKMEPYVSTLTKQ